MKDPTKGCTIFIAGEVNSGKSSFLNALSGGIVSNVSLERETFNPIWYQYSPYGTEENLKRFSMELESVHKQNESLRQSLKEQTLKEEEVSSFLKADDVLNDLPIRYGLNNPYNLVDLPGINDAEDTEKQLFFTALQNQINLADLIIFVTDATTAFSKASEIIEFKKIQQLVEEENIKGHYIELIIVVNKFDSLDDHVFCKIFNRIFEKLPSIEHNKVFRFSSHKMLIDNVLRSQLHLYLPVFNKSELQRVLNSCNVHLTPSALTSIKKERILRYTDIVIQKDISNELPDEEDDSDIPGKESDDTSSSLQVEPYYQVINFIHQFQSNLHQCRVDSAVSHLEQKWKELKDKDNLHNEERSDKLISEVSGLLSRFDVLCSRDRYEQKFLTEVLELCKIIKNENGRGLETVKKLLCFFWKNLLTKDIITHIQSNADNFSIYVHEIFAALFIANPRRLGFEVEWTMSCCEWLKLFGSSARTFQPKALDSLLSLKVDNDYLTCVPDNPLLSMMISKPQVPKQMRILLWLSTMPLTHLEELDRSNNLPYEILEDFSPGMIRSLRFLMSTTSLQERGQPLHHKFFNLDQNYHQLTPYRSFLQKWNSISDNALPEEHQIEFHEQGQHEQPDQVALKTGLLNGNAIWSRLLHSIDSDQDQQVLCDSMLALSIPEQVRLVACLNSSERRRLGWKNLILNQLSIGNESTHYVHSVCDLISRWSIWLDDSTIFSQLSTVLKQDSFEVSKPSFLTLMAIIGPVPDELNRLFELGQCVTYLTVSRLTYREILPELHLFPNIQHLNLRGCGVDCNSLSNNLKAVPLLTILNIRSNQIDSVGCQSLSINLKSVPLLTHLNISSNQIGDFGCQSLSNNLNSVPLLTALDISSTQISDVGCQSLSNNLNSVPLLTHLNISSNKITYVGCQSLSNNLKLVPLLTTLDISSNEISAVGCESLSNNLKSVPLLTTLGLVGNQITDVGCESLSNNLNSVPLLTILNISSNQISDVGCQSLSNNLASVPLLTNLDISSNKITYVGCQSLSNNLKSVPLLTTLWLGGNQITDVGCESLSNNLNSVPLLTHLNISSNQIGSVGCQSLSNNLASVPLLTHLNISSNPIGSVGCQSLSNNLKLVPLLTHLNISWNQIGDVGCQSLSNNLASVPLLTHLNISWNQISSVGCQSLSSNLASVPLLTHLNISWNQIGDVGCQSLSSNLASVPLLSSLSISRNQIGDVCCQSLRNTLASVPLLTSLDINHNQISDVGCITA